MLGLAPRRRPPRRRSERVLVGREPHEVRSPELVRQASRAGPVVEGEGVEDGSQRVVSPGHSSKSAPDLTVFVPDCYARLSCPSSCFAGPGAPRQEPSEPKTGVAFGSHSSGRRSRRDSTPEGASRRGRVRAGIGARTRAADGRGHLLAHPPDRRRHRPDPARADAPGGGSPGRLWPARAAPALGHRSDGGVRRRDVAVRPADDAGAALRCGTSASGRAQPALARRLRGHGPHGLPEPHLDAGGALPRRRPAALRAVPPRAARERLPARLRPVPRDHAAERDQRYRRYGASPYIGEPNVKESAGGLRDIHTAMWLGAAKFERARSASWPTRGSSRRASRRRPTRR